MSMKVAKRSPTSGDGQISFSFAGTGGDGTWAERDSRIDAVSQSMVVTPWASITNFDSTVYAGGSYSLFLFLAQRHGTGQTLNNDVEIFLDDVRISYTGTLSGCIVPPPPPPPPPRAVPKGERQ